MVSSQLMFGKKRNINCRTSSTKGLNESTNSLFLLYEERVSLVSGKKLCIYTKVNQNLLLTIQGHEHPVRRTSEIMIEKQNFNQFKLCCLIIWLETTHHFLMMVKNSASSPRIPQIPIQQLIFSFHSQNHNKHKTKKIEFFSFV